MKLKSHSLIWADFHSQWYRRWARELLQDGRHKENFALYSNKFWQNAVMAQALWERNVIRPEAKGIGFGVGQERLPALFAKHGVRVMATDQDFTTEKAKHWSKHELARSTQSLNRLGICDPIVFEKQVSYMPIDMNKVPATLHDSYDFAWSNCALGHLGSIESGLRFIEQSLRCLVPGGWAVHTTELNILSNDETVSSGDTVLFRLKDIYELQRQLIDLGYSVIPFVLQLGGEQMDKRITLNPQFGNDFSKIEFAGHLATQIVLIFHKPRHFKSTSRASKRLRHARLRRRYAKNLEAIEIYKTTDETLKLFQASKQAPLDAIRIEPVKRKLSISIAKGETKKIKIGFRNNAEVALFGVFSSFGAPPILLATDQPVNRESKFYNDQWPKKNRLSMALHARDTKQAVDFLIPKRDFYFYCTLGAVNCRRGRYHEAICVVQEGVGIVHGGNIQLEIEVT